MSVQPVHDTAAGTPQDVLDAAIGTASVACRNSVYGWWCGTIDACRLLHRWCCTREIVVGWRR
jgi:hypothetical protein